MADFYDRIDLMWDCTNGDLVLGQKGDLRITDFDVLYSLVQDVYIKVKSERNDWRHAPMVGAQLDDFIGEPNSKELGKALRTRIVNALVAYSTIALGDCSVDCYPVSRNKIAVTVSVRVLPTSSNRNTRILNKVFLVDSTETNIQIL